MFAVVFICHLIYEKVTDSVCSQCFTTFVEPVSPPSNLQERMTFTAENTVSHEYFCLYLALSAVKSPGFWLLLV